MSTQHAATFEIVTTTMGAVSIRDNITKEIMHNPVGPWVEANALYIDQSDFKRRLTENLTLELVVFDVGLGAAANALAALHAARALKTRRPMRLISFERELRLLQFALDNAHHFDHFKGFEDAVQSILNTGKWEEDGIIWELRHGDFTQLIDEESNRANVIFYDPYSSKKNGDMWNKGIFKKVREKCAPDGILFTYSRATPIRVSLLLAGFYVGQGIASGLKDETSQAAVRFEDLQNPLGEPWLGRWQRSHIPNAFGARDEDLAANKQGVLNHPQFANGQT